MVRIAEAAQPTPAIPLGGFLPTSPELAAAVGTPPAGLLGQPVEGGPDVLLSSVRAGEAAPTDCLGVAYRLQRTVYDGSPVRSVATNSWAGGAFDGPPVSVFSGVVQMSSPSAAQAFFAYSGERWRHCNGATITREQSGAGELNRVADVTFDGRVVSASVLHTSAGTASPTAQRALALSGDCIVEVEITDPRATAVGRPAVGVAELIANKIAAHR